MEDESKSANDNDKTVYSFGMRFYYWKYYKNNNDQDILHHPGYTYDQLYVNQKFKDMKEEITENPVMSLSMQCYRAVIRKAEQSIELEVIKNISFNDNPHCIGYEIDHKSVVKHHHLIAVLCYTDFSEFSYRFSKTFRKQSEIESVEQLKQRNGNYYFLSKYLREMVECFGTKTDSSENNVKYYYMGLSRELVFPSYLMSLNGPTTTTAQLAVATVYATRTGMIVTLTNYDCHSYFKCSLLSAYQDEDERLFMGGCGRMRMFNLRTVKGALNYIHFITPITKFDMICNAEEDISGKLEKKEVRLIGALIDHYLNKQKNTFPLFVNQLYASFVENKQKIKIDLSDPKCMGELASVLISKQTQSLVKMDYLCKIFPNLGYIEIKHVRKKKKKDQKKESGKYERCDDEYDVNLLDITNQTILNELKSQLLGIKQIGSNIQIVFKGVKLDGNSRSVIDNSLDQYIRFETHSNPKYENMIVEFTNNDVFYNDDTKQNDNNDDLTNDELKRKLSKVQKETIEMKSELELKTKIISDMRSANDELQRTNQKHVESIELLGALCDDKNAEIKRLKAMINDSE